MPENALLDALVAADREGRRRLIDRERARIAASHVDDLSERARAAAQADPVQSLRLAGIAAELAEVTGGARAHALALRAQAVALRAQGRPAEALEAFTAGTRAAEEAQDPLLAAQILIAATETLAQLGRHDEALALAADLEQRLLALGAEEDAAKVVANAGGIHFWREAYPAALTCWQDALAYFERRGQAVPVARLRMNIANVLTHLNRLPEALDAYESARALFAEAGMRLLVAGIDGNVGFLQFQAGRYTEALQAFTRARETFEALQLRKDVAQCDREIADVYRELNLIPEARASYERVLPVFIGLSLTAEVARVEMGLAAVLAAQDRQPEAAASLDRAERVFRESDSEVGVARVRLQRVEDAARRALRSPNLAGAAARGLRSEARAAAATFRRHGLALASAQARLALAELRLAGGESPGAALRRLIREADAAGFVTLLGRMEAALARSCARAGKLRAALGHYRRAAEAVERARALLPGEEFRIAFFGDKARLYEEMLALLLERGTPAALTEAFAVVERSRSRALLELLAGAAEARAADRPACRPLVRRLQELRAQLNWDYRRLQRADGDGDRLPPADTGLSERVRGLEAEFHGVRRQLQILAAGDKTPSAPGLPTVRDLQALLERDEHLVEYGMAGEEVVAFVVGRGEFHTLRHLARRSTLARQVERLRYQWSKFALGSGYAHRHMERLTAGTRQILRELYTMLLAPLEGLLPGARVTVVPHGPLHAIPFHALDDGTRYALDRWEFAYAPSAAVWQSCRTRRETAAARSLVFGVADARIENVHRELAGLRRLLPDAEIYADGAATLAAVPTEGVYRYVHFATHAVFRQDNPLFSGLRLADGWLVAHDLYHRRLECSLATLSACRTGVNALAPGDEMMGLTRGFLHAGARAVMVSLWTAHDAATAELMEVCYEGLARGLGRAAALRAAQQALRSRYPHPYHWAPFALIGAR